MEIALVIVGGVVFITLISVIGDVVGKSKLRKSSVDAKDVQDLVQRVESLERLSLERENRIGQLESDIAFANRLLEDKHGDKG